MAKHGKKYRAALDKIEEGRLYGPMPAFTLLKEVDATAYDATVECAFRLGIDPRKADQMVRGAVSLPHGIGKSVTVLPMPCGSDTAPRTIWSALRGSMPSRNTHSTGGS